MGTVIESFRSFPMGFGGGPRRVVLPRRAVRLQGEGEVRRAAVGEEHRAVLRQVTADKGPLHVGDDGDSKMGSHASSQHLGLP